MIWQILLGNISCGGAARTDLHILAGDLHRIAWPPGELLHSNRNECRKSTMHVPAIETHLILKHQAVESLGSTWDQLVCMSIVPLSVRALHVSVLRVTPMAHVVSGYFHQVTSHTQHVIVGIPNAYVTYGCK